MLLNCQSILPNSKGEWLLQILDTLWRSSVLSNLPGFIIYRVASLPWCCLDCIFYLHNCFLKKTCSTFIIHWIQTIFKISLSQNNDTFLHKSAIGKVIVQMHFSCLQQSWLNEWPAFITKQTCHKCNPLHQYGKYHTPFDIHLFFSAC